MGGGWGLKRPNPDIFGIFLKGMVEIIMMKKGKGQNVTSYDKLSTNVTNMLSFSFLHHNYMHGSPSEFNLEIIRLFIILEVRLFRRLFCFGCMSKEESKTDRIRAMPASFVLSMECVCACMRVCVRVCIYFVRCLFVCAAINPVWCETLDFTVRFPDVCIFEFKVYDKDTVGKDFLGQYFIHFRCIKDGK